MKYYKMGNSKSVYVLRYLDDEAVVEECKDRSYLYLGDLYSSSKKLMNDFCEMINVNRHLYNYMYEATEFQRTNVSVQMYAEILHSYLKVEGIHMKEGEHSMSE